MKKRLLALLLLTGLLSAALTGCGGGSVRLTRIMPEGKGAMYDTHLFAKEPSGVEGGRSIIDMGNMPVLVTPNEYRDGIIRSMQ